MPKTISKPTRSEPVSPEATSLSHAQEVQAYIDGVMSGKLVTGKWQRRAVERHLYDLRTGSKRGLHFDQDAAELVIDFFGLLKHSKGEWAGKPFTLSPWQKFILWVVFGWMQADGTRRFRSAYTEICRKNGKSTFAAGVGLYLMVADGEAGAEIYAAATKRDQARILWSEAQRMISKSPSLKRVIRSFRSNLSMPSTYSKFEPLGKDGDTLDGLNPHGILIDELHAHKSRDLFDVLDSATGARRQPMLFVITTAGKQRRGVCWDERAFALLVLEGFDKPGGVHADSHFAFVAGIDDDDDWQDEACWAKANPGLHVSVKIDDLRRKAKKAAIMPSARNEFLCKHLNRWTDATALWLNMTRWDEADPGVDPLKWRKEKLAQHKGKRCLAALDLGAVGDLTALTLLFPLEDGSYDWLPFFWVPEASANDRERVDRVTYPLWIEQGLITPTDGDVTDFGQVEDDIDRLADEYGLQELAVDRLFQGQQLIQNLVKRGLPAFSFGQGFLSMAGPTREFEELVIKRQLHHGNNPVLRWQAGNAAVESDPAGNLKPNKAKSSARIDGIVTGVMAVGRASLQEDTTSVYESDDRGEGLLILGN